jgi:AcrR family transcriptional regulator
VKTTKDDRRSQRTQRLITEALVDLMAEKRYDAITVQEILERANVGRSTFYTHYYDKEDVLATSVERMLDALRRQVEANAGDEGPLVPSLALFRHVASHYHLYEALVRGRGAEVLFQRIAGDVTRTIEAELNARPSQLGPSPVPIPIVATHVAGTLLTLLLWWLERRMPYPPEAMDTYFQHLLGPELRPLVLVQPQASSGGNSAYPDHTSTSIMEPQARLAGHP